MSEITPTLAYNIREDKRNTDLIISAEELRQLYLFGVNLSDGDGNEMPDELLEHYISASMEWLEIEIPGLILKEQEIVAEVHDYYAQDYREFGFLKLFHFPVRSISRYAIQFPLQTDLLSFDPSWIRVDSVSGHVNLVPTEGTLSAIILGIGGSFLPLLYNGLGHVPGIVQVDYLTGFSDDSPSRIPNLIKDVVAKKASLGPLNIAGDLIAGAGIASKSISLDGLSQSISTTSSATNAGYGARMINYGKEMESDLKGLRAYYNGIKMVVA